MSILNKINGKKILIWGYGKEGKSTEKFLKKCCNVATMEIYEGSKKGIDEGNYDLIIKSPGIMMKDDNPKYTSQTELFLEQFHNNIIGITGTKGKSTTSSMLYYVLKECYQEDVVVVGNMGRPCLDYYEEITENTCIVYEMSCHQLAHLKVSPHIAIFLNFYEEHLDYYSTIENYFKAKVNITKHQAKDDFLLVGRDVPDINTRAKKIQIFNDSNEKIDLQLNGEHNKYNAQFVYKVAVELLGCNENSVCKSMNEFKGLPHRLEYIGEINGVSYYDDSIATIQEATISAVKSISNAQTILIGGMDRKINYNILINFIKENQNINFICMYESGKRIYNSVQQYKNCYFVVDLEKAVQLAKKITVKGKACILSPAAASYGWFENFEERGNWFRKYVFHENIK